MRIVHIAPDAPYNDGWGYQENLLPKYQALLGHEVALIITNKTHLNGELVDVECQDFESIDGFRVIRRQKKYSNVPKLGNVFARLEIRDLLMELRPDFVFFHGLISPTIFQVTKYKKHINSECVIVLDNHLDYNIGFDPKLNTKKRLLAFYYKIQYKLYDKYISRVYGVTPWRKKFAEDVFGVPSKKTDVLIMGADDEKINFTDRDNIKAKIRRELGLGEHEFLIVTGAKIDKKKNIHILMQAVQEIDNIHLIVFGNVMSDIKDEFIASLNDNVTWIGWVNSDRVYDYFLAADLVFFPGQHSVLWEQACASKVPCVFLKWEGMDHVNNGGNADFINANDKETIMLKINELLFTEKYERMKKVAFSEVTDIYLYSNIAKKSLEMVEKQHVN